MEEDYTLEWLLKATVWLVIGIAFYLLPSWIAWKKKNVNWVIGVNFFLGWTIIGWLLALGLALTPDKPDPVAVKIISQQPEDNLDKIKKLKALLDAGAITQQEFDIEKKKLLSLV